MAARREGYGIPWGAARVLTAAPQPLERPDPDEPGAKQEQSRLPEDRRVDEIG